LPKLSGVAINGDFCVPSRLFVIRAANFDPIEDTAVRPDQKAGYSPIERTFDPPITYPIT